MKQTQPPIPAILALFTLLAALPAMGAAPDPAEILKIADRSRGSLAGIEWTIAVESGEDGRRQEQTLTLRARDLNSLAEFQSPAKVKGQKLLLRDRNMWYIKPGLIKPVPISPRQKLMGGASYGDIASTNYAGDYRVEAMGEETVNGHGCWVLDLVAVDRGVTYDRIRYWVSKELGTGLKAVFFTVSGQPFKEAEFEYGNTIRLDGQSIPFVSRMTIRDTLSPGNVTTLEYSNVTLKPVPDAVFNLNLLVR
jgi:outer membrane lipoprotein-sorting protein